MNSCILLRRFAPRNDKNFVIAIEAKQSIWREKLNILQLILTDCMNSVAFQNAFGLRDVGAADNHAGRVGLAAGKAVHVFYVAAVLGKQLKDFVKASCFVRNLNCNNAGCFYNIVVGF